MRGLRSSFQSIDNASIHCIDAVDTVESESCQPLFGNQRSANDGVPESSSITEVRLANGRSCSELEELLDIYGVQLFTSFTSSLRLYHLVSLFKLELDVHPLMTFFQW